MLRSRAKQYGTAQLAILAESFFAIRLFDELFCRLRLALGDLAIWQSPLALATKRQCKKFAQRKLMFLPVCSDTNRDCVLGYVSPQRAMQVVPPAKHRAPI